MTCDMFSDEGRPMGPALRSPARSSEIPPREFREFLERMDERFARPSGPDIAFLRGGVDERVEVDEREERSECGRGGPAGPLAADQPSGIECMRSISC